jgi:hypothetical protein
MKETAVDFLHSEYNRILGSVMVTPQQIIEMSDALENAKEIEKSQRQEDFINGYKARAKLSGLIFDEASELTAKELFKQQEQ